MLTIHEITDASQFNEMVDSAQGHPMQKWQWGELKAATGPWTAHRVSVQSGDETVGCAQVLVRKLPWPFGSICYAPRGPVVSEAERYAEVSDAVADWCHDRFHPVSLKIDPPATSLSLSGAWVEGDHGLMATTAIVDLEPDEDAIMKSLHSRNARNYIRRGAKVGIEVVPGTREDVDTVIAIYHETADRDGFPLHPDEYYHQAFDLLGEVGQLIVAKYEGEIVSFMWNVTSTWGASELWAGANATGRKMRANYPLKWGAMKAAKAVGAQRYDMNGLLNDGISEFKKSFQNVPTIWAGTYEKPLSPLYHLWDKSLALFKAIRRRKNAPRQKQTNN
ncbi:MAG: peptidoglycan bridge formation glycyltransferase FemA/FemB family protein [Bifidobacterium crudilactis]|nr:peptidoglycan bridge formation glycyltransferase FemA/FemB family protein [Bifidobacterium crudilactis]